MNIIRRLLQRFFFAEETITAPDGTEYTHEARLDNNRENDMSKNINEERERLEELAGSDWSVLVARFGRATEAQIKEEADWMWPSDDNEEFAHRLYEALQVLQDNRENDMNFEQAMRTIKKGQNSDEANQAIAAAIAAGSVRGEWSGKKWESTYVGDWIAAGDLTGDEWDEEDE